MTSSDCAEYRRSLEDIVGAYFEHGDGPGLQALLHDANRLLIDNAVSHRHEGWEGPAEGCPICRSHDALRRAENQELESAAEADNLRAELRSALGQFPIKILPCCMMPDGAPPCEGYLWLQKSAEMMGAALHRIGDETLVPGNWSVLDQTSLNGMVSAVRHMSATESRHALVVASLEKLSEAVTKIAESRKDDWDFRGYALALMGVLMEARGKQE